MVNFKTFFAEGLGLFPRSDKPSGVMGALKEPLTPAEEQELARQRNVIAKYKERRGQDYPKEKYSFALPVQFRSMIANAYRALPSPKKPDSKPYSVLLLGDPGIGKSDIIEQTARELSVRENKTLPSHLPDGTPVQRKYIQWNKASEQEKDDIMENPEKYYMFMDLRSAYLTVAGMEGLPVPVEQRKTKAQFFKSLPQQFISVITNPQLAGMLFLDEINQASPEVTTMLYQIILNREFKDVSISPRILVVGAANLVGTSGAAQEMGPALSSRFVGAVLVPDPDAWFDWAIQKGIDPIIVDYVRKDPDGHTFFKYPSEGGSGGNQWPNPRAIERYNTQFKNLYEEYEDLKKQDPTGELARKFQFREKAEAEATNGLGPEWGEGFGQYLRELKDVDLEELASSEEKYKTQDTSIKQRATNTLVLRVLQDIDDCVTSPVKSRDVGAPPLKTYPVDEQQLDAKLSKVAKKLLLHNPNQINKKFLVDLKTAQPDYTLILLDYLVKDDAMFKVLAALEAEIPEKVSQQTQI